MTNSIKNQVREYAFILLLLLALPSQSARGAIFNLTFTVNGQSTVQGFSTVDEVFGAAKLANIQTLFPGYTESDQIAINLDYRGLPIILTSSAGSADILLNINDINISQTFQGESRDASFELLKDWLKKDGGSALNAILKKLAEVSPFDPLAGNPQSLMGKMVAQDYEQGTTEMPSNTLGVDLQFRQFDVNGEDSKSIALPFSYSTGFEKVKFFFNLPVVLTDVAGSKTYDVGLTLGSQLQLFNRGWILTGTWGTGLSASPDLGGGGRLNSTTITSKITIDFKRYKVGMGNMFGSYSSQDISIKGIRSNPGLKNSVMRNGLFFTRPLKSFEWDLFVIDTRYSGDPLFMDQYNELGTSIGIAPSQKKPGGKSLKAGATYLLSSRIKGFSLNMGFGF